MKIKEQMVELIGASARQRVGKLAGELVRSPSQEREDILAEMEFQRWLAESCDDALRKA